MAIRLRLSSIGRRVVSWARGVTQPTTTMAAQINRDFELPFLQENLRTFAGEYTRRLTPGTQNFTAETPWMRQAYRAMIAEPMVKSALFNKIAQIARLNLQVVPQNKKNPVEAEAARFVRSQLLGASGTFFEIIYQILSGGFIDGFSVCEKLYGTIERGEWKGHWTIPALKSKDTHFLQIEVDPYQNVTGIYAMRANYGEIMDPNDFVVFSYLPMFCNPIGNSDLRAAYRSAEMIKEALKLRMVLLDKFSGPFLVGKSDDPAARLQMQTLLRNARGQGWAALSTRDQLEVENLASGSASQEFQAAIDDYRKEIVIAVRGAYLTMLEGANNSARGSSAEQADTVEDTTWLGVVQLLSCINQQLVPDLVRPNYGEDIAFPHVMLPDLDPENIKAELEIDDILLNRFRLPLEKEAIYDLTHRVMPTDANNTLSPPPMGAQAPNSPGQNTPQGGEPGFGKFSEGAVRPIAAVAVVTRPFDGKMLLIKSNAADDRHETWCSPGGHIEGSESPEMAAARECKEETGVKVKPIRRLPDDPAKPGVAFIECVLDSVGTIKFDLREASAAGWFSRAEMEKINLYPPLKAMLSKFTEGPGYEQRIGPAANPHLREYEINAESPPLKPEQVPDKPNITAPAITPHNEGARQPWQTAVQEASVPGVPTNKLNASNFAERAPLDPKLEERLAKKIDELAQQMNARHEPKQDIRVEVPSAPVQIVMPEFDKLADSIEAIQETQVDEARRSDNSLTQIAQRVNQERESVQEEILALNEAFERQSRDNEALRLQLSEVRSYAERIKVPAPEVKVQQAAAPIVHVNVDLKPFEKLLAEIVKSNEAVVEALKKRPNMKIKFNEAGRPVGIEPE